MNKTAKKIIEYIARKGQVRAHELVDYLEISRQAIFKHYLTKMVDEQILVKTGRPPQVYYSLAPQEKLKIKDNFNINAQTGKVVNNTFLFIAPTGERKEGLEGFKYWCARNDLPVEKTINEYCKTIIKYDSYKRDGLISGSKKLDATFSKVFLDELFYLDFYSIERFGKTKSGQLLLYAKQSQNRILMKEIIIKIKPNVDQVIKRFKIDGIGFIPPTVKREIQLMKVIEKKLNEQIRRIKIVKLKTEVVIPQKTLNKLKDRIENARNTIVIEDDHVYNNILLIDDAVGSGATLNETAKKIRERKMCRGKIIGLTITGSFKEFDVISEL